MSHYTARRTTPTPTATGGGANLADLLTVAFVVLKLCHVIDWSWWWVLAPTWLGIPLGVVINLLLRRAFGGGRR
jgi:hypothetical protein